MMDDKDLSSAESVKIGGQVFVNSDLYNQLKAKHDIVSALLNTKNSQRPYVGRETRERTMNALRERASWYLRHRTQSEIADFLFCVREILRFFEPASQEDFDAELRMVTAGQFGGAPGGAADPTRHKRVTP